MNRTNRIALLAAAALIVAVSGTVLATRSPSGPGAPAQVTQDEEDAPPTAEEIAHAAERLEAAKVPFDEAQLNDLAATYGLGGAVRILAWSNGDETVMATIRAKRDGNGTDGSAMGWGRIAKEMGFHPGIGSIMGNGNGNGHGRDTAPGQQDRGSDEDDAAGG